MKSSGKHQYLAASCGFCSGVTRALDMFHQALKSYGAPIYVLRELVHNTTVTSRMESEGAVFIRDICQVPEGVVLLLGAHGITKEVEKQLSGRHLTIFDATCPLVSRLHKAVADLDENDDIVLFGKAGHPESDGILSQAKSECVHLIEKQEDIDKLPNCLHNPVFLSQTTMNYRDCQTIGGILQRRYPDIRIPAAVCRASHDRQTAVEQLAEKCDFILVIGSPHSSNAQRLVEISLEHGVSAQLVENGDVLPDLSRYDDIGITAGASTPQNLILQVQEKLSLAGYEIVK